ncbi:substrate-binding domain-containing protein [Arthrobacter sp. ISL-28]|nr:substrate-binding domain-containing protein [Arthrobacter sp. ISL-28]
MLRRSLVTGKSQTIGVVAADIDNAFYARVLRGIRDVARSRGFGVILTNSDENLDREREAVQLLLEKRVDSLIVAPCDVQASSHLRNLIAGGCPTVQIDQAAYDLAADSVTVDNRGSAREAVDHLLKAGHRRIGIVAELEQIDKGTLDDFVNQAAYSPVTEKPCILAGSACRGTLMPTVTPAFPWTRASSAVSEPTLPRPHARRLPSSSRPRTDHPPSSRPTEPCPTGLCKRSRTWTFRSRTSFPSCALMTSTG